MISRRRFTGLMAAAAIPVPARAQPTLTLEALDNLTDYGTDPIKLAVPYIRIKLETRPSVIDIYRKANSWGMQLLNQQQYRWPPTADPSQDVTDAEASWDRLAAAMLGYAISARSEHGFSATVNARTAVEAIATEIYGIRAVVNSAYACVFDLQSQRASGLAITDFQKAGAQQWAAQLARLATSSDFLKRLDAEDVQQAGKGRYHGAITLYKLHRLSPAETDLVTAWWSSCEPGSAAALAASDASSYPVNVFDQTYVRDYAPSICSSFACSGDSCTVLQTPGAEAVAALVNEVSGTGREADLTCITAYTYYENTLWQFIARANQIVPGLATGNGPQRDERTYC